MPWQRTAAVIAGVAVVAAGLGTYFGLRGHAPAGGAAGTPGYPAPRAGAAMAYDAADGTVVMFGGAGDRGAALGDTWTWNGSAWAQQHPRHSPPAVAGAVMAYDAPSGRLLLFGGEGLGEATVCTAFSSGSAAAGSGLVAPSGGAVVPLPPNKPLLTPPSEGTPPPAAQHLTPACKRPPQQDRHTWAWNGQDWTRLEAGGPQQQWSAANLMATDPRSGRPLLVAWGGVEAPACGDGAANPVCVMVAQVWTWSGKAWVSAWEPSAARGAPADVPIGNLTIGPPSLVVDPTTRRLALVVSLARVPLCEGSLGAPSSGAPAAVPPPKAMPAECPLRTQDAGPSGPTLVDWTGRGWGTPEVLAGGPLPALGVISFAAPAGYDSVRNQLVFAGVSAAPWQRGQSAAAVPTWVWTGSAWARHDGRAPGAAAGAATAFDASSGQLVLFGGVGYSVVVNGGASKLVPANDQTWTWDGSAWTMRGGGKTPTPGPVPVPQVTVQPSALPPHAVGGGSGTSGGCSNSWSTSQQADGTVALTLSVGGPADCSTTFGIARSAGESAPISGLSLTVSHGSKAVVWSNWCSSGPLYLVALASGASNGGGGSSQITPPSCADKSRPSTWKVLTSASPSP